MYLAVLQQIRCQIKHQRNDGSQACLPASPDILQPIMQKSLKVCHNPLVKGIVRFMEGQYA